MVRFILCLAIFFSFSSAAKANCLKIPSMDFSSIAKKETAFKIYTNLGSLENQCWYFRDVGFKNGHGQQAIVVANRTGKCLGLFRVTLANSAELVGALLLVKTESGEVFKTDLSNGIPKSLFFDGDISNFERCIY